MILIGLTGREHAGKTTVAQYMAAEHGFDELTFAYPIKQALALIFSHFGLDASDFEDPAAKVQTINEIGRTPRELMQTLGTEWGRNIVCDKLWMLILARRLATRSYLPAVVISDLRFGNEAQWIRDCGGEVWGIIRPRASAAPVSHASEIGIAPELVDRYLLNDTTVPALLARVDMLLKGKIK